MATLQTHRKTHLASISFFVSCRPPDVKRASLEQIQRLLRQKPQSLSTPELQVKVEEGENHAIIERMQRQARFDGATEVITIDGLRVEYPDGFGLVRASNTTPVLVCRFEADDEAALARICGALREAVLAAKPGATLPF